MMTVLFKDVQSLSRAGFPVIAQLPVQSFSDNIETADPFFVMILAASVLQ